MENIKMRVNNKATMCPICNSTRRNTIEIFDLCIGDTIITLCDACNEKLFNKTLKATVMIQSKVKTKQDIQVIQARKLGKKLKG